MTCRTPSLIFFPMSVGVQTAAALTPHSRGVDQMPPLLMCETANERAISAQRVCPSTPMHSVGEARRLRQTSREAIEAATRALDRSALTLARSEILLGEIQRKY